MEFLDGETLADRLRRSPMRVQDVLHCAIKVAEALSHAHLHGLMHRDLKPANIMLTSSGVKVLGFGLARTVRASDREQTTTRTETLTHEGTVIGTYPYMSPEQLQGGDVDARSDIFAFGAVLHEMLTGQAAFAAEDAASTIAAVLDRDPPPVSKLRSDVPASLDWIVQTCLQKNREDRWQAAHDVKLELERVCDLQSHTSPSLARHSRHRGVWVAAAAVGALMCGIAGATVWSQWTRSERSAVAFRFQVPPPPGTSFAASLNTSVPVIGLSICPDGSKDCFRRGSSGNPDDLGAHHDRTRAASPDGD
jgi:eukaryotic-like serine/threonine-protein kinase